MQRYIAIVVDSLSSEPGISRTISLGEGTTPQANAARLLKLAKEILSRPLLKSIVAKLFSRDSGDSTAPGIARSYFSTILEDLLRLIVQSKENKDRKYHRISDKAEGLLRIML